MFEQTFKNIDDVLWKEAGWGVVDGSRLRREERITLRRLQGAGWRVSEPKTDRGVETL